MDSSEESKQDGGIAGGPIQHNLWIFFVRFRTMWVYTYVYDILVKSILNLARLPEAAYCPDTNSAFQLVVSNMQAGRSPKKQEWNQNQKEQ